MRQARWYKELVAAFETKITLSADQIGEIVGCYGPDAVTRVRQTGFPLVIVGELPRKSRRGKAPRLYGMHDANDTDLWKETRIDFNKVIFSGNKLRGPKS